MGVALFYKKMGVANKFLFRTWVLLISVFHFYCSPSSGERWMRDCWQCKQSLLYQILGFIFLQVHIVFDSPSLVIAPLILGTKQSRDAPSTMIYYCH